MGENNPFEVLIDETPCWNGRGNNKNALMLISALLKAKAGQSVIMTKGQYKEAFPKKYDRATIYANGRASGIKVSMSWYGDKVSISGKKIVKPLYQTQKDGSIRLQA
jgi:hypothetical protein